MNRYSLQEVIDAKNHVRAAWQKMWMIKDRGVSREEYVKVHEAQSLMRELETKLSELLKVGAAHGS